MALRSRDERASATPATVHLERLSKHFRSPEGNLVKAVDDISLELAGGSAGIQLGEALAHGLIEAQVGVEPVRLAVLVKPEVENLLDAVHGQD